MEENSTVQLLYIDILYILSSRQLPTLLNDHYVRPKSISICSLNTSANIIYNLRQNMYVRVCAHSREKVNKLLKRGRSLIGHNYKWRLPTCAVSILSYEVLRCEYCKHTCLGLCNAIDKISSKLNPLQQQFIQHKRDVWNIHIWSSSCGFSSRWELQPRSFWPLQYV